MTPLVAGIALTGKAPVYENVYMSGLKQKAAGEAAKAKERSKQFDDIRAAIKITGPVHNSLVEEAKDLAAETFVRATEAAEKDPIRGINKAQEFLLEFQAKMNMYQNTSKTLAKLEEPQYGRTYFSSPLFVQGIGTKNFKDIESDQGIVQDAQNSGITIQRINGVPVVATQDFPRFDPSKSFVDWQKNTVSQYEAQLGDPTLLGASKRQEILKKVNEEEAISYLEGRTLEDPSEVFAWRKMHGIDITTEDGRKEAAKRFLYTQEKAQTASPGGGGRGGFVQEMTVIEEDVEPIRTRFGGNRVITANKAAILPLTTFMPNYNGAFITGEKAKFTKLSESQSKSYGSMQTQTIQNIPTWKGRDIELPAGTYGDVKLESSVTIMKGMPLPTDVKNGILKYIDDDKLTPGALQTIFGETDKAKIKAMIVDDDWIVGSGVDAQGNAKEETTFAPANPTNLKLLSAQMQGAQKQKIAKKLIDAANNKSILYKSTSEAKGAEKPQSFDLLNFEQPTA